MESDELARLVARMQAGDEQAACAVVTATHAHVARLVRAYRGRVEGESDMIQEVYAALFTRMDRYRARDGVPFVHWLSRLTVNVCKDLARAEARRRRWLQPELRLTDEERQWIQHAASREVLALDEAVAARQLVTRLLAELSPDDRLLLTLLDVEQRTAEEVSQMFGWGASRVRVRAMRARRRLQGAVERLARGRAQ